MISDGNERKIDAQVDVAEGEGTIGFADDGMSAVCEFNVKVEAGDGVYADPMVVSLEIDKPVTLSVTCVTTSGKLRVKFVDSGNFGNTVYFDETDLNGLVC